jgi:hypothetical protein
MENCCSDECKEIINLPLEEQKLRRKGLNNSNQIFKKGRSFNLKFKTNNEKPLPLIEHINSKESVVSDKLDD